MSKSGPLAPGVSRGIVPGMRLRVRKRVGPDAPRRSGGRTSETKVGTLWELAVQAFEQGHTTAQGLEYTVPGLTKAAATKMLAIGVPSMGLRPVGAEARERIEARVAAEGKARTKVDARAAARQAEAADKSRAQGEQTSAELVRMNRLTALAMGQVQARLLRGAVGLAEMIEGRMAEAAAGKDPTKVMSTRDAVGLLRSIANISVRTSEVSARAVEMERRLLGRGDEGGDELPKLESTMTLEDAEQWFELAVRIGRKKRVPAKIDSDADTIETDGESSAPSQSTRVDSAAE